MRLSIVFLLSDAMQASETRIVNILSVQSWVAYGHVGNAAALFPLQRLGAEVFAVNTVQFSNHPGYGDHAGRITGGDAVAELLAGLERRGILPGLDAVLSGYLGDAGSLDAVLGLVARARQAHPGLLFCCDPVLGDRGPGVYVAPSLAEALRHRAVPEADILLPNMFELGFLLDGPDAQPQARDLATLARDAARLRARMRPGGLVLVTSVVLDNSPPGTVGLFLATPRGDHLLYTPELPAAFNGAGDLLSALFLWGLLRSDGPARALDHAASAVWCVLDHTAKQGAREPMVVQAQDQLLSPWRRFASVPAVP
ncbi:pyridoxal kinase [Acetobacteraceae bacterium KSS8]|uniref:pyridoxal kinase n=1 Tax=Endosaccharibacter trunci TaxID=2812733 RepID=A0ABT1W4S7_9PROT|nr:pyridoxal kinase [Acetobacteraceae bacterium KSS8]